MFINFKKYQRKRLPVMVAMLISLLSAPVVPVTAVAATVPGLPEPGALVTLSEPFAPARLMGIHVYPDRPLTFDFIVDPGEQPLEEGSLEAESARLIKYFLAALTVPEDEMWVNLSPYEENRIIPAGLGQTQMGRDMLALDYMLKQLSSSLMHPDERLGSAFWQRVYQNARQRFGSTDIPINTFNKIWIVPEQATVFEHAGGAFIVESHLKVMLEEDYLALEANRHSTRHGLGDVASDELEVISGVSGEIVREVLIPEIEAEINNGRTFAKLRQIYHSMLLASWYKKRLRESLLGQVYVDKQRTQGIEVSDREINHKIYEQYVASFQKGVFNLVKEEIDPDTHEPIPRKYFSGGVELNGDQANVSAVDAARDEVLRQQVLDAAGRLNAGLRLTVGLDEAGPRRQDRAMLSHSKAETLGIAQRVAREEADEQSDTFRKWYAEVLGGIRMRNNIIYGITDGLDGYRLEAYLQSSRNNALQIFEARRLLRRAEDEGRPVILEIGSGNTHVALQIAQRNPGMDVIATDIWQTDPKDSLREYVADAVAFEDGTLAAQTAGLDNLAAVRAQADLIGHLPDGSLDTILLVNPSRGAIYELVVMAREFGLAEKLRPGGQIIIKTTDSVIPFFDLLNGRFDFQTVPGYEQFGVDLQNAAAWPQDFLKGNVYVGTRIVDAMAEIFDPTIGGDKAVLANVRTVARQYEMDEGVVQGILASHIKLDAFVGELLSAVRRQNARTLLDADSIRQQLIGMRLVRDGLVTAAALTGDLELTEAGADGETARRYPISNDDLQDIVFDSVDMEPFALQLVRLQPMALNRDRASAITENDLQDIRDRLEEYLAQLSDTERARVDALTLDEGLGRAEAVAWVLGEKWIAERRQVAVRSMDHSASAAVDPFDKLTSLGGIFSLAAITDGYGPSAKEEFRAMANTLSQFQKQLQTFALVEAKESDFYYERMYDFEKRWRGLTRLISAYIGMFRIQAQRITPEQTTHAFLADQTAQFVTGVGNDLEGQIAFAQGNTAHNRRRVNIAGAVQDTVDNLARRRGYEPGYVTVEAEPGAAAAEIEINPTWLSLVVSNLVNNAHDELKKQVAAGQRAGFRAGDIRVRLDLDERDGTLELSVHDTAGGIQAASPLLERRLGRLRLFEFGRTEGKESGTGVGLAEVFHISRLMGWDLALKPQAVVPGTDAIGARFALTIPVLPKTDQAVLSTSADEVGGIDMNPGLAEIRYTGAAGDAPIVFAGMSVPDVEVSGFVPVILNAVPARNIPLMLGLE